MTAPKPVRPYELDFSPLRRARKGAEITQAQLARAAGIHPITLWRMEQNKIDNPQIKVLIALSRALGIPMHHLFTVTSPE